MLNRTTRTCSPYSTRTILPSFHMHFKQTSIEVLLNNDVYPVEIVLSEVGWFPVKVKGIQHMRVFESYSKSFFLSNVEVMKSTISF